MEYENEQYFAAEFQEITKAMEEYLKPVLSLFDFSELRLFVLPYLLQITLK